MSGVVLRHSTRDAILVALAAAHGALLLTFPSAPIIALALWWTANTVAHNFIHLPFFRSRIGNSVFSVYLSLLLGIPQTLWRDRHIAHHAAKPWRMRWNSQMLVELGAVTLIWVYWGTHGIGFFLGTWVLGWAGGLMLCQLQGYFEHARGTVSHYSTVYNVLFFNDGYHVEHHARPGLHWSQLPQHALEGAARSRLPAVLRWLELAHLDALERMVLRSRLLQRFVMHRHARAFEKLLPTVPAVKRVTIVGGALFPRTALILRRLIPDAELTIVDQSPENISCASAMIDAGVRFVGAPFVPALAEGADLVVFPLAFDGEREELYANPPAGIVAVHDWIWRKRGQSAVISLLFLKRLNFVRR